MRAFLVPCLLLLAAGCVSKPRYLALESRLGDTESMLASQVGERDQTIAKQAADIATLEGRVRDLNAELSSVKADLAAKEAALDTALASNAAVTRDKGALAGEIARMKAALADLEARKAQADARLAEFRDLLARFKSLIDAGTLQVKIVDGRMVVALATDVLFASGSASLSDDGKKALTEVAAILATIPDRQFQVEGHTDNVPIASSQFPSNWFLASARSINVVTHLISGGMSPQFVSGASFGEHRPVANNDTKESRALNRRIEIVVVPDLSQLPGYDELQKIGQ